MIYCTFFERLSLDDTDRENYVLCLRFIKRCPSLRKSESFYENISSNSWCVRGRKTHHEERENVQRVCRHLYGEMFGETNREKEPARDVYE